jgi:hypothetical protein
MAPTASSTGTSALTGMPSASGQGLAKSAQPFYSSLSTGVTGGTIAGTNTLLQKAIPTGIASMMKTGTTSLNLGTQPGFGATGGALKTTGLGNSIYEGLNSPLTKLGLGSMALSSLPINATLPNIGDITAKWLTADTVTKAGEAAKKIADTQYAGDFQVSKETQAYSNVMEKDIRKAYAQRRTDLDKSGMAMSDQFMTSGERLDMLKKLGDEEQIEVDRMKAEWLYNAKQQYAQDQYNYVMTTLQADETTKRDLLYGELSEVLWKYNLQQEDILNFRKIAADAGMYALQAGLGIR